MRRRVGVWRFEPAVPEPVVERPRRDVEAVGKQLARADGAGAELALLAAPAGSPRGMRQVDHHPAAAVAQIAHEAQTPDTGLIGALLCAVRPISRDLRLDPEVVNRWADFDARIAIVGKCPDVARAFDVRIAR